MVENAKHTTLEEIQQKEQEQMQQTMDKPRPSTMGALSSKDSRMVAEMKRLERENVELRAKVAELENRGI